MFLSMAIRIQGKKKINPRNVWQINPLILGILISRVPEMLIVYFRKTTYVYSRRTQYAA